MTEWLEYGATFLCTLLIVLFVADMIRWAARKHGHLPPPRTRARPDDTASIRKKLYGTDPPP